MGDGTLSYGGLANSSHRSSITMITEGPPSIDKHGVNRDLDKKHWCLPHHFRVLWALGHSILGTLYFFTPATTATWLYIGVWPHSLKQIIDRLGTKESNERTILQRRPFRTILCLNHETWIFTYVHSIINGSCVIASIRFHWTKFRVTVVYVIRITFLLCST